ncbi:FIST signal transduction protein [Corallincola platygyrae]|uniref:FIST signal transduction protein n=1 Tax=Corallincola platygyrae TaxID=1193278 RepID=A0ABW4XP28_9GAMM
MKLFQTLVTDGQWHPALNHCPFAEPALVFVFGNVEVYRAKQAEIRQQFPQADIVGCSSAGEIHGTQVSDNGLTLTAVKFDDCKVSIASQPLNSVDCSYNAGTELACQLPQENLRHLLIFSDGIQINGTALVNGLTDHLPEEVTVSGGLAGDGEQFCQTFTWHNDKVCSGQVIAIGLHGDALSISHGSRGGWDTFGPKRKITKAKDNQLYQLDGMSALALYKKYLGEYAVGLPASGLLFPLSISFSDDRPEVVRTILGVDEDADRMTFAGEMPEGAFARLMKANFERLIDGASDAAEAAVETDINPDLPTLALLVSCIGRKMVLNQRTEEEVEAVQETFGDNAMLTGFYSYGELSPVKGQHRCVLHNQTMTITAIQERKADA